ncbi:hypothetical protein GIB67_040623 [Kingdonia uniflora]|uniref:Uncharacterized protein n=1 Tax=Kingdonia uniflora TaxID=39325 RepID=A0A7J7M992_9MAGN|nr:hypothetical protein GIB67_040623 [Kingdonia uniflora]
MDCILAKTIWNKILIGYELAKISEDLMQEVNLNCDMNKENIVFKVLTAVFSSFAYHIWRIRNIMVFRGTMQPINQILKAIAQDASQRMQFSLSTDSSYCDQHGGYGALLRNNKGELLYAYNGAEELVSVTYNEMAIYKGMLWLLSSALYLQWQKGSSFRCLKHLKLVDDLSLVVEYDLRDTELNAAEE